jgi:hypothetical protein
MGLVSFGTVQRQALYVETGVKGNGWENKVGRKLEALSRSAESGFGPRWKKNPPPFLQDGLAKNIYIKAETLALSCRMS